MPSSPSNSSYSSLVLLSLLIFVASMMVNAQMTFSDGWGKRSTGVAPFALLAANKRHQPPRDVADLFTNEDELMNPAMEACHVGYAQRLVQLHEQMLALFGTYQQCQAKAAMTKKSMAKS